MTNLLFCNSDIYLSLSPSPCNNSYFFRIISSILRSFHLKLYSKAWFDFCQTAADLSVGVLSHSLLNGKSLLACQPYTSNQLNVIFSKISLKTTLPHIFHSLHVLFSHFSINLLYLLCYMFYLFKFIGCPCLLFYQNVSFYFYFFQFCVLLTSLSSVPRSIPGKHEYFLNTK